MSVLWYGHHSAIALDGEDKTITVDIEFDDMLRTTSESKAVTVTSLDFDYQ